MHRSGFRRIFFDFPQRVAGAGQGRQRAIGQLLVRPGWASRPGVVAVRRDVEDERLTGRERERRQGGKQRDGQPLPAWAELNPGDSGNFENRRFDYVPSGRFIKARPDVPGWTRGRWFRVLKGRLIMGTTVGIANGTTLTWKPGNLMNRPFRTEPPFGPTPGTSCRALMSGPFGTQTMVIDFHGIHSPVAQYDM